VAQMDFRIQGNRKLPGGKAIKGGFVWRRRAV